MFQNLSDPITILKDRILWYDGDSSYSVEGLRNQILNNSKEWMNNYVIDPDDFSVRKLNELEENITLIDKKELLIDDDTFSWNIPEEYNNLPVDEIVSILLNRELNENDFSDTEKNIRIERVKEELNVWEERSLFDLLKTLMYIVDTFVENNIVWGTGRGSSCSSYILYLIGIHDVDSVYYDLDIRDFFRV